MVSSRRNPWGRIGAQALLAGIAGAILIDGYLYLTTVLPQHGNMLDVWRFFASVFLGKGALAAPGAAWTGLAIHVLISIAWAAGYAYLAAKQPVLDDRWFISGLFFGLVVYLIMQCILLAGDNFTFPPTTTAFVNEVGAYAIFFGLPVAYVVSLLRPRDEPR